MAVQGSRTPVIEPTDPLYIHSSDNPGIPLVSNPWGKNFDNWKRSIIIALFAKHKLALVDGKCPHPGSASHLLTLWERNNAMVLSWLLNSLNGSIWNSVLYFETARELWLDLEERFGQSNKASLFQVQKDVSCLSQGDLHIATYYTRAKQPWDEFHAVRGVPKCNCAKCKCEINGRLQKYTEEQKLI